MNNKSKILSGRILAGLAVLAISVISCERLDDEIHVTDEQTEPLLHYVVVAEQTSGIIDVKALTKSTSNVTLTSQPRYGSLENYGKDLLRYVANSNSTKDAFSVSVRSGNSTAREDSVIIIRDTTLLPAISIVALTDYVNNVNGPVLIDVLKNDILRNIDKNAVEISIFSGEISNTPIPKSHFGTLEVVNGKVKYTPGPEYKGKDKFIYKLTKKTSTETRSATEAAGGSLVSYGFVYISSETSCRDRLKLNNDLFEFSVSSLHPGDTLLLPITANDVFCTNAMNDFSINLGKFPKGSATFVENYSIHYILPSQVKAGFIDAFSYRLCVDEICKEAEVIIKFK
jgi:hypothetical protein